MYLNKLKHIIDTLKSISTFYSSNIYTASFYNTAFITLSFYYSLVRVLVLAEWVECEKGNNLR